VVKYLVRDPDVLGKLLLVHALARHFGYYRQPQHFYIMLHLFIHLVSYPYCIIANLHLVNTFLRLFDILLQNIYNMDI
jgi:hypothetical protein